MEIVVADTEEKLKKCLRIRHEVFTLERKVSEEIEVDRHDCLHSDCRHFLILEEGEAVGAFRCAEADPEIVRLQRFCVLQKCRGKGVAREALALAEAFYRREKKRRIEMDAKYDVCGFYEKCGYVRESAVFEEAGIPHVKMGKEL
ncbi:MAG: GNAT family N-acetyltransferase [Candidatus Gastranaerophilales bacterium]|nr:GNAT family N-acetyltransferase [Candidatus Gastranaerophilales bacterium]